MAKLVEPNFNVLENGDVLSLILTFITRKYHLILFFVSKQWKSKLDVIHKIENRSSRNHWRIFENFILNVLSEQNDNINLYSWTIQTFSTEKIKYYFQKLGNVFNDITNYPLHSSTNLFDTLYPIIKDIRPIINFLLFQMANCLKYSLFDYSSNHWMACTKEKFPPHLFISNYVDVVYQFIKNNNYQNIYINDLLEIMNTILKDTNITIGIIVNGINDGVLGLSHNKYVFIKNAQTIPNNCLNHEHLQSVNWEIKNVKIYSLQIIIYFILRVIMYIFLFFRHLLPQFIFTSIL